MDDEMPERLSRGSMPAVFMFQPTGFEVVKTPEKLREWERLMRERVGLQTVAETLGELSGLPTISYCDYACDCDQI